MEPTSKGTAAAAAPPASSLHTQPYSIRRTIYYPVRTQLALESNIFNQNLINVCGRRPGFDDVICNIWSWNEGYPQ